MEFHIREVWTIVRSRSQIKISDIFELLQYCKTVLEAFWLIQSQFQAMSHHHNLFSVLSITLILSYNLLNVVRVFPTPVTLHLFSPILATFIAHCSHPDCSISTILDGLNYKLWTASSNILLQSGPNIFEALSVHAVPSK